MNVLLVHNSYQQPGGEDHVFQSEAALLEAHGHTVSRYHVGNDAISGNPISLAVNTIFNRAQYRGLASMMNNVQPDVVHVHNTFPLISPAVYYAAQSRGIPIVQTLHNYRLVCPGATLYRDGKICDSCSGKLVPWRGVVHRCYRGSVAASGVTAAMLSVHHLAGTWSARVAQYVVLSEFCRRQFAAAGFPQEKLAVKPNFIAPEPAFSAQPGDRAVFVGRLAEEKGIATLLAAWKHVGDRLPLEIIGDGPMSSEVRQAAQVIPSIRWRGWLPREEVYDALRRAAVVIVPSLWFEPFGLVVAEAFAAGTPVLASAAGGLSTMVAPGRTGDLFQPGDEKNLAEKLLGLLGRPEELAAMRRHARDEFEKKYTAETNYRQLLEIYNTAGRSKLEKALPDRQCSSEPQPSGNAETTRC
jgi:glycosyltransferase involved in cell wall biosynthesis